MISAKLHSIGRATLVAHALVLSVHAASPGDQARLEFARQEWHISESFSDAQVIAAFDAKHYGIDWRDWISAFDCRAETVVSLTAGSHQTAWEVGSSCVAEEALEEIALNALGVPALVGWSTWALSAGLNFLQISAEVEAYRHQQDLYFQARPFNSAAAILNLTPFDLLEGVDITKEGRGWLFHFSGYLLPFPTTMEPADFFALAELAWAVNGVNSTQLAAESTLYGAAFASAVTNATVLISPTIKLTWTPGQNCAIEFSGVLQQSTTLTNWEDVIPQPVSPYLRTNSLPQFLFFRARSH